MEGDRDYASKEYWERRYRGEGGADVADEWYYTFADLLPVLERVIRHKESASIIEVGCGDQPLLPSLRRSGWQGRLLCVDFSSECIKILEQKEKQNPLGVEYLIADGRNLESTGVAPESFGYLLDKGCMDAMLSDSDITRSMENCRKLLHNYCEAVHVGGSCIIVSHLHEGDDGFDSWLRDCVMPVLSEASRSGNRWFLKVYATEDSPNLFIITKAKSSRRLNSTFSLDVEFQQF